MQKKTKPAKRTQIRQNINPLMDLNRNIEALVAHLCAYVDVLKQCDARTAR